MALTKWMGVAHPRYVQLQSSSTVRHVLGLCPQGQLYYSSPSHPEAWHCCSQMPLQPDLTPLHCFFVLLFDFDTVLTQQIFMECLLSTRQQGTREGEETKKLRLLLKASGMY